MTTRELLATAWVADPFVIAMLVLATLAYAVAFRGRLLGRQRARAILFGAAMVVTALALVSPIGVLAHGVLFSAHMLQHLLLVLVVPPLVILSLPRSVAGAKSVQTAPIRLGTPGALRFLLPWFLGVGAMWLWHAPKLCDAASQSVPVLRAQTVSLLVMGGAFFWPVLGRVSHRLTTFGGMIYLFTACAACTVLGILVTFSPIEVCSVFAHPVDSRGFLPLIRDQWGLTTKADQEIGGLMMWVPGCLIYASCIVATYGKYAREERSTSTSTPTSTRVTEVA